MTCMQTLTGSGYFHYRQRDKLIDGRHSLCSPDKNYRLLIHQLNAQHKDIFSTLNKWHNHWENEDMSNLTDLLRAHFSSTEELMLAYGYAGYALHKSMHKLLLQQLDSVQSLESCEYRRSWIDRLEAVEYLHASLTTHIIDTDKKLRLFFKDRLSYIIDLP